MKQNPISKFMIVIILLFTFTKSQSQVSTTVTSTGGTAGTSHVYTSLALAITAINTGTAHTGTIVCTSAAGSEIAPVGGYKVTLSGTAANPISFIGTGVTLTAFSPQAASSINDAVIKFIAVSYCTVQGFNIQENAANATFDLLLPTTAPGNNMTEFGIEFASDGTNGCSNNTIQNNTITMNSTYPAAIGIFFTSDSQDGNLSNGTGATTQTGCNNNNKVYTNTISSVEIGICFLGTDKGVPTIYDGGNDIGGYSAATGNTITNFGGIDPTASALYGGDGTHTNIFYGMNPYPFGAVNTCYVAGIYTINQAAHNISYNTITGATRGQNIYGIYNFLSGALSASAATPTITYTTTVNNNLISVQNTASGTNSGSVVGIQSSSLGGVSAIFTKETAYILNNKIYNSGFMNTTTLPTSQGFIGIISSKSARKIVIDHDTVQNITIGPNNAGFKGITYGISGSGIGDSVITTNNQLGLNSATPLVTFLTANNRSFTGISVLGSMFPQNPAATTYMNFSNNDIEDIKNNVAGTVNHTQIYLSVPSEPLVKNVIKNTFTNIQDVNTIGNVTFISLAYSYGMAPGGYYKTDSNRIVTGYKNAGISGNLILLNDTTTSPVTTGTIHQIANNFSNITVAGTTSILGWLSTTGTTNGAMIKNVSYDSLMNWSGGSGNITGMTVSNGGLDTVSHNIITGFTVSTSAATTNVTGLLIPGGANNDIFKNKICNHEDDAPAGSVYGLSITGSPINLAYDNLIGDYRTPTATPAAGVDAVIGINLNNAVASTNKIYNNSIRLGASGGTGFNAAGIYENTVPTSAMYDVRYNIIDNNSTAGSSGIVAAVHRSSTTTSNYATTSTRNVFYGGTPNATSQLLYYDGTNKFKDTTSLHNNLGGREIPSYTENTTFQYTNCDDLYYLRIHNGTQSFAEGNAITVPEVATDYAEVVRPYNNSVPDIGAYEFRLVTVPDTVKVKPTTPTSPVTVCPTADDINVINGTTTYSSCGTPSTFGSWTLNASNCLVWQGNGTQTVTDTIKNCVIACNGLICDTTFIKILPSDVITPLNWTFIKLMNNNCNATVYWNVDRTNDVKYFEIEKSNDSRNWTVINKIVDVQNLNYSYKDIEKLNMNSFTYYRIKETEKSGNVFYSIILKAKCGENKNQISIFPNPTDDKLVVDFSTEPQIDTKITFNNLVGQKITVPSRTITNNRYEYSLKNVPNGVYTVSIFDKQLGTRTYKIIKK